MVCQKSAKLFLREPKLESLNHTKNRGNALKRFNPAAPARPRCPRPYQSDSVKDLTDEEMNSLLDLVKGLADGGSVVAKRDYALLLLYFLTGRRRNEVITLRGSDAEISDGGTVIKYRRKGGRYTKRAVDYPAARDAL